MEFLGVGPLELIFILIIALIVLGPKDMVKAGRTIGRMLRKVVTSPNWRAIQQTSRELRTLPNRLIREAGLEELKNQMPKADEIRKEAGLDELKQVSGELSEWTTPPAIGKPASPPEAADKAETNETEGKSEEE